MDDMDDEDVRHAVEKWTVWAGNQPPANLRKVAALRLDWPPVGGPLLTASLAAGIALWFPNLKELGLKDITAAMLPDEVQDVTGHLSAIIRGGLARLPHLVKLTLPSWSLLGALGSMQHRKDAAAAAAGGPAAGGGGQAGGGSAGGSSGGSGDGCWLSGLQELEISSYEDDTITDEHIAGLASIRSLRILRLRGCAPPGDAAGLLPLLSQLPRSLERLSVLPDTSQGPLGSGLEARFAAGQLKEVTLASDGAGEFRSAPMRDLGDVASGLLLPYLRAKDVMLRQLVVGRLRLRLDGTRQPHEALAARAAVKDLVQRCRAPQPQPQPQPLQQQAAAVLPLAMSSPPQAVVARAVQRLLASPRVTAPAAGKPTSSGVAQLLVLQGPLVAGLAHAPELVDGWVKWLAKAAAAPGETWRGRCQLVPRALGGPALLLQPFGRGGAAAALHAAVRSVEPGAQLGAAWVAVERYPECRGIHGQVIPAPLLRCLQQELDITWALSTGGGGGAAGGGTAAPTATAPTAHAHAPSLQLLQEQARWLLQLDKALAEELPRHVYVSVEG
ncbi:hypothetical protein HXX76_012404 [Chlamydomonas incerta]|uniref:Uncharacterized protein n=1 Tax=Chlamydomonas incerta TaxID=51695 RepID=A0A835VVK8_CHLIN|nr:hypothetical protein HXX76_012404 [Chlamydomonas incerta]|eukprot:KAG2427468.1 hypothetical protein HXX76_012404 [Chlamydomonas incerta]